MKSLPGSQPLLGEISPELVAGILGRSYDATPCVWLPFRSVFSSCPSLLLSLRLVLSFSLFLFLVLLLFCSVAPLISSITLLYFFFILLLFALSHISLTLCLLSTQLISVFPPYVPLFLSFSPLFPLVFFFLLSPCLFLLFFCSIPPLAFIARGCMRYGRHMVTAGVHYGGEEISRETCLPLIAAPPLLFFLQKPSLEDSEQCAVILNETASFQFQNDISDLVLGCFYNFVIKPPPPEKL